MVREKNVGTKINVFAPQLNVTKRYMATVDIPTTSCGELDFTEQLPSRVDCGDRSAGKLQAPVVVVLQDRKSSVLVA